MPSSDPRVEPQVDRTWREVYHTASQRFEELSACNCVCTRRACRETAGGRDLHQYLPQRTARRLQRRRGNRRSNFDAGQLADEWGLEIPAEGRDRLGHAAFVCQGPNSPTLLRDLRQNVLRNTETTSFSLSDNVTWITGRHSLRVGGAWSRNHILDGFSAGANEGSGQFLFNGAASGNSFSDFLLGVPFRSSAQIISSTGCSPTARRRLDLCRCPQPCRPSLECLASASCSSPCGAWR